MASLRWHETEDPSSGKVSDGEQNDAVTDKEASQESSDLVEATSQSGRRVPRTLAYRLIILITFGAHWK